MQKWEYYVFHIKHLTNEDNDEDYMFKHLNDMGKLGWENYSVIRTDTKTLFYYKKPSRGDTNTG